MKTRIITGSLLALVAVLVTLLFSNGWFALLVLLVKLLAWMEWNALVEKTQGARALVFSSSLPRWMPIAVAFLLLALILWWMPFLQTLLIALAALYWIGQALHLLKTRRFQRWFEKHYDYLGVLLVAAAWAALVKLHALGEQGPAMALGAMLVVWAADSAAYFSGRRFGKKQLAPQISPKKTLEGVYGGMICAAGVSFIYALFLFGGFSASVLVWVIASVVAAIVSVVGDLFESQLKRMADVKDSGNILPGHGGVLDRVDGLLAAMPVFLTIWLILT